MFFISLYQYDSIQPLLLELIPLTAHQFHVGAPISIGNRIKRLTKTFDLETYEEGRRGERRSRAEMRIPSSDRYELLKIVFEEEGVHVIDTQISATIVDKWKRHKTRNLLHVRFHEFRKTLKVRILRCVHRKQIREWTTSGSSP